MGKFYKLGVTTADYLSRLSKLFFKKSRRIKELENELSKMQKELDRVWELAEDNYFELQSYKYDEESSTSEESDEERCSCGGVMKPMYDEYPNWIKFCSICDARTEESDFSPILEP